MKTFKWAALAVVILFTICYITLPIRTYYYIDNNSFMHRREYYIVGIKYKTEIIKTELFHEANRLRVSSKGPPEWILISVRTKSQLMLSRAHRGKGYIISDEAQMMFRFEFEDIPDDERRHILTIYLGDKCKYERPNSSKRSVIDHD